MNLDVLKSIIADDNMGILELPVLTKDEEEIVKAFSDFIINNYL